MAANTAERNFPVLRVADESGTDDPAEVRKRMLKQLAERLDEHHAFAKGQFVAWKPGLKNKTSPDYGEPAIVTAVLPTPVFDQSEASSGSPYFQEPLSIVIGIHREDDLLEFRVDGRRFEPVDGRMRGPRRRALSCMRPAAPSPPTPLLTGGSTIMGMDGRDEPRILSSSAFRCDNRDARPPGHQVMGDLQHSAGAEAHRQRAVRLVAQGLGRMEEKGAGVRRCGWREAKLHLQRLLLEHAERALGVSSEVEVLRRRARLVEDFEPMDRIEAEEHRRRAALDAGDQVGARTEQEAIGDDLAPARRDSMNLTMIPAISASRNRARTVGSARGRAPT